MHPTYLVFAAQSLITMTLYGQVDQQEVLIMKSVKIVSAALVTGALLMALGGLSGCEKAEGPGEQAGRQVDEAVEQAGEKVEKATESMQEAVKSDEK